MENVFTTANIIDACYVRLTTSECENKTNNIPSSGRRKKNYSASGWLAHTLSLQSHCVGHRTPARSLPCGIHSTFRAQPTNTASDVPEGICTLFVQRNFLTFPTRSARARGHPNTHTLSTSTDRTDGREGRFRRNISSPSVKGDGGCRTPPVTSYLTIIKQYSMTNGRDL